MNFRELIKIKPARFWLFVVITVLTPIAIIGNTALVQLETTIVLSRNLRNFVIISAISLVVAALSYVEIRLLSTTFMMAKNIKFLKCKID